MAKRVWVLGAGFSRPLGGPLLNDLFSMRSWWRMIQNDPHNAGKMSLATFAVYYIFHHGRGFPEGYLFEARRKLKGLGENRFDDAEQFLIELETMNLNMESFTDEIVDFVNLSNARAYLSTFCCDISKDTGLNYHKVEALIQGRLVDAATDLMAAECDYFVPKAEELKSIEGTIPFREWARTLGADDSIITFNYDRVVEVLLPNVHIAGINEWTVPDFPQLFKMHGSVDWFERGGKIIEAKSGATRIMGMPGKMKLKLREGILETLWDDAKSALSAADEVHIIGYGLPESDASARKLLLDGLYNNKNDWLDIKLVLGEEDFRRKRMFATLKQALSHRDHRHESAAEQQKVNPYVDSSKLHGMWIERCDQYAQDYLAAYSRSIRKKGFQLNR